MRNTYLGIIPIGRTHHLYNHLAWLYHLEIVAEMPRGCRPLIPLNTSFFYHNVLTIQFTHHLSIRDSPSHAVISSSSNINVVHNEPPRARHPPLPFCDPFPKRLTLPRAPNLNASASLSCQSARFADLKDLARQAIITPQHRP